MAQRRRRPSAKRHGRPPRRSSKNANPQVAAFILVAVILAGFVFLTSPKKSAPRVSVKLPEKAAAVAPKPAALQPVEPAVIKEVALPVPAETKPVPAAAPILVKELPAPAPQVKPQVVPAPQIKPQAAPVPVKPLVAPVPAKPQPTVKPAKPQIAMAPAKPPVPPKAVKPVKAAAVPKPAKPQVKKEPAKKNFIQRLFTPAPKPRVPKPVKVAAVPAPKPKTIKPAVAKVPLAPQPAFQPVPRPAVPAGIVKARIAIVIDDWGYNPEAADMIDAKYPVTCAVLPNLGASRQVAERLHGKGLEIILHLPMEPREKLNLENDTITTAMNEGQIRKIIDKDLESVSYAKGINNHMGSLATADKKVMKAVFKEMKKKRLYFLDSSTAAGSVGPEMAPEFGIDFAKRNVFIDNDSDPEYIKKQLLGLALVARTYGSAVGIGHARPNTLEALKEILPELDRQGYKFVFVSELAK